MHCVVVDKQGLIYKVPLKLCKLQFNISDLCFVKRAEDFNVFMTGSLVTDLCSLPRAL